MTVALRRNFGEGSSIAATLYGCSRRVEVVFVVEQPSVAYPELAGRDCSTEDSALLAGRRRQDR
jgi:predicted GNAT family N-acyltransferase